MSDQFIGEIRVFAGSTVPTGWVACNGQLLSIAQPSPYIALFSLLGTFYGGDGKTTFAVPNLQASVPLSSGQGPGLTDRYVGENGGVDAVTLPRFEMASHSHTAYADTSSGGATSPQNAVWGVQGRGIYPAYYSGPPNAAMNPESLQLTGADEPHNNLPPYLVLNFCIAYQGEYPSRA